MTLLNMKAYSESPNYQDLSSHDRFRCGKHPEAKFHSKNPYQRSTFIEDGSAGCKCPVSDLLWIKED